MIRRYTIISRHNHACNEPLRKVVDQANVHPVTIKPGNSGHQPRDPAWWPSTGTPAQAVTCMGEPRVVRSNLNNQLAHRYDPPMSEGDFFPAMGGFGDSFSLVPHDFVMGTDVPFIDLLLVSLGHGPSCGLSHEPAVRDFVRSQPGLYEAIRALGAVVAGAGVRVRDSGQLRDSFDCHITYYTSDELWCFDMATDVLAMLAVLPGVSGSARFSALDAVRDVSQYLSGHWFHKHVQHAVDAPRDFGALRSWAPARTGRLPRSGPGYM
jgi:hypothetical protein